jgi:hypothetical protein
VERTRKTLFVPASYLLSGGLGLVVMPDIALKLMLSNGAYGDVMPRFAGVLTIGLGALVVLVIRHRLEALYLPLVFVRAFFCTGYVALYLMSSDPFFLVLLALVGFGATMTAVQYLRERTTQPRPAE